MGMNPNQFNHYFGVNYGAHARHAGQQSHLQAQTQRPRTVQQAYQQNSVYNHSSSGFYHHPINQGVFNPYRQMGMVQLFVQLLSAVLMQLGMGGIILPPPPPNKNPTSENPLPKIQVKENPNNEGVGKLVAKEAPANEGVGKRAMHVEGFQAKFSPQEGV